MNTIYRLAGFLILGIVVVSFLTACAAAPTQAPAAPTQAPAAAAPGQAPVTEVKDWPLSKGKRICHIIELGVPYSTAKTNLGAKEAALFGFQYDVYDTKGDIPTEISEIEDCIAKKYDTIILVPYDPTALNAALKKARDAGIPVIAEGATLDEEGLKIVNTLIGSSGIAEGKTAGSMICKALGATGGNWVMIEGAPAHPLVPQRGGEAEKWVQENCPNVKLLGKETGQWNRAQARTVMENFLTANPGKIDLVYCHNDDMCMGAAKAVSEAGLKGKIKVIGVDGGNKEAYDAIRAGDFYGTVLNDASWISVNMIQRARDLLENRPILHEYISPADAITKENVDNYTPWW
jgi:ABC-type sugar transport system substrate-binding protein